ncbi:mini-chromosome maintenance complex-binding protein-like [Cucurbita pepo subsp. pepo]|uniref:mini-chromosome maintenance complex-binding protein-like n=1 Tax=Cucurbita pepo subsp. pepo TaxID=3664 RepID=UPI000C9D3FA9|nr:mini-chromosome maintenance complex-binding protein-like [Cucurbita pepo subsp. pepo]
MSNEHVGSERDRDRARERERATMVGLPYDFLVNPLGAVRSTFDQAISSGSNPASFDGKDWGALDPFRHFLFDQDGLSKVPILNASSVKWVQPNCLVRFKGMIQDMLGNEFYVGAYKDGSTWKTTKFTDSSQCPTGISPDMRIWERRLLYCVPVPGQNSWTESSRLGEINQSAEGTSENKQKRCRLDENSVDPMDLLASSDELQSSSCAKKMKDEQLSPGLQSPNISSVAVSSLSTVNNAERNFLPCLVKMYDTVESELKLNDVFEFIGVITLGTEQKVDKDDDDEFSNGLCEDLSVQFPPDRVPCLHCVVHRKLAVHDFQTFHVLEPTTHLIREIRTTLLNHLTIVLGNDGVAAHFLLLHLLSKVHARVDSLAVGKLSLNLTGFNNESMSIFGNQLRLTVKCLLPFTEYIPLTVEYLNTASLAPKKDFEINRLVPGVLQLAEGSHLMIDETQLEIGTLNSLGVENARLLKTLMESQKVEYDFKYYKMDMTTDVQLLILSEGKSNILPADLVVPFQPSSVGSSAITDMNALEAWRWYLSNLRSLPHSIESEMQQVVENDLVAAKQADRSLGSQDLSRLLTIGRLMSASYGETSLSLEHWQMVKELERLRRERLT